MADFYVPNSISTIGLPLRRTCVIPPHAGLVRSVILLNMMQSIIHITNYFAHHISQLVLR